MSWGPATVYVHERLPDAKVVPGEVDRVELLSPGYRKWAHPTLFADKRERASVEENVKIDHVKMNTATANAPSCPTLLGKVHARHEKNEFSIHKDTAKGFSTSSPNQSGMSKNANADVSAAWDPDTPTLKNWARQQLMNSQYELEKIRTAQNYGISSDSDSGNDASSQSSSTGDTLQNDKVGKSYRFSRFSASTSSDDLDIDNVDLDSKKMNIGRFSYYCDSNGAYITDSDSDDEIDNGRNEDSDDNNDSDIDGDEISANLEQYYHVNDDSENTEDEDDVDEIYDDSS